MAKTPVKDRSLLSLSWPLIITFGVGMFQPMMDSWFLSRTSEDAAAGVGALMPVIGALFTAIQAFSQAGASIASQYMGASQQSHARTTQTMVLLGSLLLGLALMMVVLPLSGEIPHWMGLRGAPTVFAEQFISVVAFGFAFRALQSTLTALIATHGLTIWNLIGNVITIASNAAMNYIFLEGLFCFPKMGVKGVALATALSWLLSSSILWLVLRYKIKHKTHRRDLKRSRAILPDWIRIGLPAAAEPVSFQLFQVFLTAMVVHIGTLAMTSRVFAGNFAVLSIILGVGIGSGNQILVAHLVGAKEFDTANKRVHQTMLIGSISGLAIALIIALLGPNLIGIFTQNEEVIALGSLCLWCDVAVQPFKAVNYILTSSMRAAGDSKFPAIVGSVMMWTLGLGTALLLAFVFDLGLPGLWIGGMAADEFYRSIVNYIRWRSGKWQKAGVV